MRQKNFLVKLFSPLLRRLVKINPIADEMLVLDSASSGRLCYVIEQDSISHRYILEQALLERGLPDLYSEWQPETERLPKKRFFALRQRRGWMIKRRSNRLLSQTLEELTQACETGEDVILLPISVMIGRAPERNWKWYQLLFSEDWTIGGPFRRLLTLMIHGRDTQVSVGKPVSLLSLQTEFAGRTRRKVTIMMRHRLQEMRAASIGPDLSHRRTMINVLLDSDLVQEAIKAQCEKDKITAEKARKKARSYALEISSDYSYIVIRLGAKMLSWFWNRVYNGIDVHHIERLQSLARESTLVYTPCHRSHFDYLLISFILYEHGLVAPHIAAGVNLNIPVIGAVLRRGGAFYIRRSFRNNRLYSAIFHQYVAEILHRGVSMEYFVEGTRSRTGKLLQPKPGMLSMTVRSYVREHKKPLVFVPIYIGYEKLAEGNSYIRELSGAAKTKESLLSLLRAWRVIKQNFGQVHVSFGDPISLNQLLTKFEPNWESTRLQQDEKPEWITQTVTRLSREVMRNINASAHVNAVNFVAQTLLSTPKRSMDESEMLQSLALSQKLIEQCTGQDLLLFSREEPQDMIAQCIKLGFVHRAENSLGNLIQADDKQAILMSYFSNNTLHAFIQPAWVAGFFVHNREFSKRDILELGKQVYPYLADEYFLPWKAEEFAMLLEKMIQTFIALDLLQAIDDDQLRRHEGGSSQAMFMRTISQNLLRTLERYFLVISVLDRHGSGTLTTSQLESISQKTAHKIALVQEFSAPEYFEKSLFKTFIATLRRKEMVNSNEAGCLVFSDDLHTVIEKSRVALSQELRHSILHCIPDPE